MWYRLISIAALVVAIGVLQQASCQQAAGECGGRVVMEESSSYVGAPSQDMLGRGALSPDTPNDAPDKMLDMLLVIICFVVAAVIFALAIIIVMYRNKKR